MLSNVACIDGDILAALLGLIAGVVGVAIALIRHKRGRACECGNSAANFEGSKEDDS